MGREKETLRELPLPRPGMSPSRAGPSGTSAGTPKANLTRASHFRQQLRTCAPPPRPAAWLRAQSYSRAPSTGQRVCARAVMPRPLALAEVPRALGPTPHNQHSRARAETPWPTARAGLLPLAAAAPLSSGCGGGQGWRDPGVSRERPAWSPAPPPDFLSRLLIPTSAQAQAASAPPLGSPLLLCPGSGAATSWRLPLKRPGFGGMRSGVWPAGDEKGGELAQGEGADDGASPLLSSLRCPLPPPPLPLHLPLLSQRTSRTGHSFPLRVPFLGNSRVGHPHLLQSTSPQSLGNLEVPDPEGWDTYGGCG